jgi:SAM-dependent methyltransferase
MPALPVRAWRACRSRGLAYAYHKALRRLLSGNQAELKRRLLYGDPQAYWTLRGGDDYFREQEDHPSRSSRADWLARRIAALRPSSVLEVGCGYGKQLGALRRLLPEAELSGVDFSPTQLGRARRYLADLPGPPIRLALASGDRLPVADRTFDLVLTSAVILHNPPIVAERIRLEVLRASRRWTAHNEDTDRTYNRYGYDTAAWYRGRGIEPIEAGPIDVPEEPDPSITQFCLVDREAR